MPPRAPITAGAGKRSNTAPPEIRRPLSKRTLLLSVAAVGGVIAVFMLVSILIGVRSIEVIGADLSLPEEIISASGIEEGSGYFSYNTSRSEEMILRQVPCISEVEIDRSVFGKVTVSVSEKTVYWYTELFGEYFVLSDTLEVVRREEKRYGLIERGLVRLDFPRVDSAVLGRTIEFSDSDRDCSFVYDFLDEVRACELYKEKRLNQICIETKFEIYAVSDLKYKIFLGKYSDATVKLDTARVTLADGRFDGEEKWYLDVSALPKVVTRKDAELDFSHLKPKT